jgi:flagellar transcriptional activator FlhC
VHADVVNIARTRVAVAGKSVIAEVLEIRLAEELIRLGARLQLLEAETSLSRERIVRLYREVTGAAAPKGMVSSSADWFMTSRPNIHSSLFHSIYRKIRSYVSDDEGRATLFALIKSYRLYIETLKAHEEEPVLSFTRAWTLPRFFDAGVLALSACNCCGGRFVAYASDHPKEFVCVLCLPMNARKDRKGMTAQAPDA